MKRFLALTFGGICYVLSQVTLIYAIGFLGNIVVPKTVDQPATDMATGPAVLINLGLLGLFAVQHSGMARQGFKEWLTRFVPEPLERSVYVLTSSLLLILLYGLWQPLPDIVWSVEHPVGSAVLWILFGAGFALAIGSTFLIDHFNLFGLRQVSRYWKDESREPIPFQTPGLYKYCRHPLMLGLLIAFWAIPVMTVGHLLFSVATTGYILVGIYFEEQALEERFGETYETYQEETPMLIPQP